MNHQRLAELHARMAARPSNDETGLPPAGDLNRMAIGPERSRMGQDAHYLLEVESGEVEYEDADSPGPLADHTTATVKGNSNNDYGQ